jgi:hypothetical protein
MIDCKGNNGGMPDDYFRGEWVFIKKGLGIRIRILGAELIV